MSDDYTHGDNVADHDYVIDPPYVVNGNQHLANMEVLEYDGLKFVTETTSHGCVRLTIYRGDDPKPVSREAYGN